ncbi:hypothetical protein RQP46_008697 [Phenoliferia psychrophenolica]
MLPKDSKLKQELEQKLSFLQTQLESDDASAGRQRFRSFYDWVTDQASNANDLISLIPPAAPFAPLVQVVFGVAALSSDGRAATEGLDSLRDQLLQLYASSLPLRDAAHKPIDDEMDAIVLELHVFVQKHFKRTMSNFVKGVKKGKVDEKVAGWTARVKRLQLNYIVPALRELEQIAIRTEAELARMVLQADETRAIVVQTQQTVLRLSPIQPQVLSKLEGLPHDFNLIGREHELERTLALLAQRNRQGCTEHVALVGPGGIGKTALATKVTYHPQSKSLGRPVFIRCEKLETLALFQTTLLRLRAPNPLQPGEDLEQAVREELDKEPTFLILDNLLDSTDATTHASYLEYNDSLTSFPTLTLLITTRTHIFIGRPTPRTIHDLQLGTLSGDAPEALFRSEYARVRSARDLKPIEPDMETLLDLMNGMPLAIVLVAAHARKLDSLEEVIRRWKEGRASDNGTQGRTSSIDFSLKLSFSDPAVNSPDTLTLLRLLAELPDPVLRRRDRCSEAISRAFDVIVDRSIAQRWPGRTSKITTTSLR